MAKKEATTKFRHLVGEAAKLTHKKQQKKLLSPFCNIIHKIAEWYVSMEDVEKE